MQAVSAFLKTISELPGDGAVRLKAGDVITKFDKAGVRCAAFSALAGKIKVDARRLKIGK